MTFNPHIALTLAHQRAADLQAEAAVSRNAIQAIARRKPTRPVISSGSTQKPGLEPAPAEAQRR